MSTHKLVRLNKFVRLKVLEKKEIEFGRKSFTAIVASHLFSPKMAAALALVKAWESVEERVKSGEEKKEERTEPMQSMFVGIYS